MLSFAAPEAAATPCGTNIGTSEIAIELGGALANLRIYDRNGTAVAPDLIFGQPNTAGATTVELRTGVAGCDYFVGFPPGGRQDAPSKYILFSHPVAFPVTVELNRLLFRPGAVQGDEPESVGIDRYVYNAGSPDPSGSFFNPTPNGNSNADVYFRVESNRTRVSPDGLWAGNGGAGVFIDEAIPDDGWAYPYHRDAICAIAPCASSAQSGSGQNASAQGAGVPFVMPIDHVFVYGQPLVKRLTPAVSMTFSAFRTVNWIEGWLTLAFAPRTSLETVSPDFRVSNVSLTASDAVQGWHGLGVSGGTATLDNVRLTGVSFYDNGAVYKRANSAVRVTNGATLTLRGGTEVSGARTAQGVEAIGATVVIEGTNTQIFANDYTAVVAMPGASVTIRDRAQITGNTAGILASGYDARIFLDNARITSNTGAGVNAVGGGLVRTTSSGVPSLRTEVIENRGGLDASGSGSVQMGSCNKFGTCSNSGHGIIRNATPLGTQTVFFDARSTGGSAVRAQDNDWAVGSVNCLVLPRDPSSTLLVAPIRVNGTETCTGTTGVEGKTGGTDESLFARSTTRAGAPVASRGGVESALAAVIAAEEALDDGDEAGATALISAALDAADTDDERAGVYGGATRILAATQPAGLVADIAARVTGAGRPYALRALAVAAASTGDAAAADGYTAALAAEYAGTDHEAGALGLRARLAATAGDETGAMERLGALWAVAPTSAAFAEGAAVVAAAFPDADLDWIPTDPTAGKQGAAETAPAVRLTVWPNPTTGAARVSIPAETGETLAVSVYDGLGRRVAVVADGVTATGGAFEAALPAESFPPGIYLVRVERRGVDGRVSVAVARLTVVR